MDAITPKSFEYILFSACFCFSWIDQRIKLWKTTSTKATDSQFLRLDITDRTNLKKKVTFLAEFKQLEQILQVYMSSDMRLDDEKLRKQNEHLEHDNCGDVVPCVYKH